MLELCDPTVSAQPAEALRQLVEDHREQAEEGHERLRRDFRALDDRLERLTHDHLALGRRVDRMETTPPNIEKMAWSTKQLIGIVSAAVVLAGGMWQIHADQVNMDKQLTTAVQESRLNGIKTDKVSEQLTTYLLQHAK